MATLTGPWRAMAGRMNEQDAGSSAELTQTPALSPSSKTARLTAGSPVAATASR